MSRELKEISRILCGYSTHKSGYIVAVDGLKESILKGGFNGAYNVRFLGVHCLEREYLVGGKVQPHREWAQSKVLSMGFPVYLYHNPDSICALRMRMLGNPAFLMLEFDGKIIRISVFTAKGLFAKSVCSSVLKLFEEGLPQEMHPLEQEETETRKKNAAKQGKKQQKEEKEQAKQEKKAEQKAKAEAKEKEKAEKKAEKEEQKREEKAEKEAEKILRAKPIESFEERSQRMKQKQGEKEAQQTAPYEQDTDFESEDEFDI